METSFPIHHNVEAMEDLQINDVESKENSIPSSNAMIPLL